MLHILYPHSNFMTLLTFTLLKGDEGRDGRSFDNSDGLYLSASIPGPQEVNEQLVFQPALLHVCGQPAHPHGPAGRCHLLGETGPLLWAGRLRGGSCQSRFGYNQQKTLSQTIRVIVRPQALTWKRDDGCAASPEICPKESAFTRSNCSCFFVSFAAFH